MNIIQSSFSENLPGVDVTLGLKQCLGKQELFQTLLRRFWEDYSDSWKTLHSLDGSVKEQETILHDVKGVASNLGLSGLADLCQEMRDELKTWNHLEDGTIERFHKELEKAGSSINKLDSLIKS